MPLFDIDTERLPHYRPDVAEPDDFDAFWARTLAEARAHDLAVEVTPVDAHLRLVEAYDLTFSGFGGHRVKGWYLRPAGLDESLPAVVEYLGYGGGRGFPHTRLTWPAAGYAYVVMDTRGQGTAATNGHGATPDPVGAGVAAPGTLTRGVEDPHDHYYRRVYTDGVRAVEAARSLPGVDPARVAVTGVSQGGAITTAVAGLIDVAAAMPDVPWLSHIRRGVEMAPSGPYAEVRTYLAAHRHRVEETFRTLSYLDGVNHARRAQAPALYSVALMDPVCPPSTVYAAANHYGGEVTVEVYPFNEHEGGTEFQRERQLAWLAEHL
ncbi:MAG TPA: acetylxylan esterase [Phototrophicaceae bacterium]|uniref:acetylxylan esterase n=1 Tax=uncultured Georgenia sp. TaxID=378209 RepID=UPI00261257CA|nr:acetylxylan esterase [uncultured Georgenia sp.]HLT84631.1 acetylxylan esterase [Phototrophicaceae bacterium]